MTTFVEDRQFLSPVLTQATAVVAQSGQGSYLTDTEGRRYIDWVQGIAVNALGHCYPSVVEAATTQIAQIMTGSFNLVGYEQTGELARRIAEIAPGDLSTTFFTNSGAEATDAALKLARTATGRPGIIAFKGSFHGRTIGATSVTGSAANYRSSYEPLMGSVYFSTFPAEEQCSPGLDAKGRAAFALDQLEQVLEYLVAPESVAAIIVEPVQGEGGYVVPDASFLQGLRKICTQHGMLLIFDEVQSGYGRTGKMFASEHFQVAPDIMTLGKALAGGLPMSAVVSTRNIMDKWISGTHGSTFGGNPVCAATGLAVLDAFEKEDVLARSASQGEYMRSQLEEICADSSIVSQVRGLGMMLAVKLTHPDGQIGGDLATRIRALCCERGLLLLGCGTNHDCVRIIAPLVVDRETVDEGLAILRDVITDVEAEIGASV
ncbi:aminotransferase class III-fold pyridoxal phosphate-dependent enzyme [Ancrocorticia populi]|uniref:(S)-3-amino-2-methylpropionate transaminase n=2 Tax=Ancrocorticia populi TaxID=2175228 RepID=A0A2V1K6F1_9ACTO|nr:aminotransferase class III-fold pyridoxal phosphate-dependent enzyme [Ancrocorticia populi]PWF26559.1 aspartate aminotransferase family protein [Ancrocorticia populi]